MKKGIGCLVALGVLCLLLVLSGAVYTVQETEQVLITQFGNVIGDPIKDAGLKFKVPFIQDVRRFEKRILEWDGVETEMPTKGKELISVDTYGRWRIDDVRLYYESLRDERSALSRLDDILGSETRNTIAKHELIEAIRTTKDRTPAQSEELLEAAVSGKVGTLPGIRRGRTALEKEVLEASREKLKQFGIELLDIRFKRINYNATVLKNIYERMISERQQIAELFRSEGAGEAAKILGNKEKELRTIASTAYKEVETIQGKADAQAVEIYAKAYNQSPEAAELYEFLRTMELYENVLGNDSTLILSTDSDVFQFMKRIDPGAAPKPPLRPAPRPPGGGN
ncbi:MAG: protease modulator HflC [Verrucomicrobiae bacterium]|nr:protease modulator HflC [Verrucomicrobiae bacterium]MCP5539146.1 protease modulator HflC [Akkermansiaceae bacterium]MCP5549797.1 protease modulator HflC [Akkermansiaceae bacterium]